MTENALIVAERKIPATTLTVGNLKTGKRAKLPSQRKKRTPANTPRVSVLIDASLVEAEKDPDQKIITAVCVAYGVSENEMLSKHRPERISFPRQVAMYLLIVDRESTFDRASYLLKRECHVTAMHAHREIDRLMKEAEWFREDVAKVRQMYRGNDHFEIGYPRVRDVVAGSLMNDSINERVILAVCLSYGLQREEFFKKPQPRRHTIFPRKIAMYLFRKDRGRSFHQIGAILKRHHKTIIDGCREIEGLLTSGAEWLREDLEKIRALLAQSEKGHLPAGQ